MALMAASITAVVNYVGGDAVVSAARVTCASIIEPRMPDVSRAEPSRARDALLIR